MTGQDTKKIASGESFSEQISKTLKRQLEDFIDDLEAYNKKREFPRPGKDYDFLRDFYTRFFKDRNARAFEVSSSEYKKVKDLANQQFPAVTLWNLCMDGRVLAVLINGASAGVGSSIRVPGGILREFVFGEDGKLALLENSNFAFIMRRALKRFNTKTIYEVYDSHVGCAARNAEEMAFGKLPRDAGLLTDVLYKKQMAQATLNFVAKHFRDTIRIVPIQTSFDPHSGFLYMGLETKKALSYAGTHGGEFDEEVLQALVEQNIILSTEQLIDRANLEEIFRDHVFSLNWKENYQQSAKHFWENIALFRDRVLPGIGKKILQIYPELAEPTQSAKEELAERAILLLTNAYSGYLHNKKHLEVHAAGALEEEEEYHKYPYGVHREEGIKVSEGGHPPYEISTFVVFSLDTKNLPGNIELAAGLIRNNRREKRVQDRSRLYTSTQEFVEAPVPVVVQEIVREEISEEEWERVSEIKWGDLPKNWDTMSEKDFFIYLQRKSNMSLAIAKGLNHLRERVAFLYDPEYPTSEHLLSGAKAALPVIVGLNRKNYFVIPFVKLGFA